MIISFRLVIRFVSIFFVSICFLYSLIVGWTWETVITTLLNWISGANSLETGQLVAVDFSVVVVACIFGYLVHLYAIRIKIPIEQNLNAPPPVNEVDTENPLQQVRLRFSLSFF
jgi:hypothetical protein